MKATVFDLESTALNGEWGRILTAGFTDIGSDEVEVIRKDVAPFRGRNKVDDSRLAVAARNRLESADIILGWNSILFDAPLLNTRLAAAGERPLRVGEKYGLMHIDLMYYSRGQSLRIGSSKLDNVAKFFRLDREKTDLNGEIWQLAAAGDKEAMDLVAEHCEMDVHITRDLWPYLAPHIKKHQFPMAEVWSFLDAIPSRK